MSNTIVQLSNTIVAPLTVSEKTTNTIQESVPEANNDLKEKSRWINCSFKNATQFNYTVVNSYFSSGRYWKAPEGNGPFSSMSFSCCNGDNAMTGVSGGTAFNMWLDSKQSFDFAVGWTNPLVGTIKAGVVESANPEAGYEAATSEGGHIRSKNFYLGKDEKGNTTKFYIQVSASPGNDPMSFVVQQVATED
ncbi:hypothetical protein C8R48DRAFT_711519 [Suillus tomentosus]|nr:hypothetical protein C8R48DRAFT_711519 [Suillus tomentosus]